MVGAKDLFAVVGSLSRAEIAVVCGMFALVGVGAAVVGPAVLRGEVEIAEEEDSGGFSDGPRGETARSLSELISSCAAVIRVRDDTGGFSLTLWRRDGADPGRVNEEELLVIAYSPVLRALSAHMLAVASEEVVPTKTLAEESFPDRWAMRSDVSRSLIATGVSAVRVLRERDRSGGLRLRISLTWSEETPDEPLEASFVVTLPEVRLGG